MHIKATPDAAWVQVASASDTALKHGVRIPSPLPCKTQPIRGSWPSRPSLVSCMSTSNHGKTVLPRTPS